MHASRNPQPKTLTQEAKKPGQSAFMLVYRAYLEARGVVISGLISTATILLTFFRVLVTLLRTTLGPPSIRSTGQTVATSSVILSCSEDP